MAKKPNYWKVSVYVAAGLALWLWGRSCGISSVIKNTGSDTTLNTDTAKIRYKPVPWKVKDTDTLYLNKPYPVKVHDTLPGVYEIRIDPADTAAILAASLEISRDYFRTEFYDTTIQVRGKDSLRVLDTVSRNRIQGRGIIQQYTDSTISTTTVLRPPQKLLMYFTGSILSNVPNRVYGVGAGVMLKLPNDKTHSLKVKYFSEIGTVYEYEHGIPIRLFKKKP